MPEPPQGLIHPILSGSGEQGWVAMPQGWVLVGQSHALPCTLATRPSSPFASQDTANLEEKQAPAAPPKPWSTFKAMTLGSLPSTQRDRLELRCADWEGPCAGLDVTDGDFQTEV